MRFEVPATPAACADPAALSLTMSAKTVAVHTEIGTPSAHAGDDVDSRPTSLTVTVVMAVPAGAEAASFAGSPRLGATSVATRSSPAAVSRVRTWNESVEPFAIVEPVQRAVFDVTEAAPVPFGQETVPAWTSPFVTLTSTGWTVGPRAPRAWLKLTVTVVRLPSKSDAGEAAVATVMFAFAPRMLATVKPPTEAS